MFDPNTLNIILTAIVSTASALGLPKAFAWFFKGRREDKLRQEEEKREEQSKFETALTNQVSEAIKRADKIEFDYKKELKDCHDYREKMGEQITNVLVSHAEMKSKFETMEKLYVPAKEYAKSIAAELITLTSEHKKNGTG